MPSTLRIDIGLKSPISFASASLGRYTPSDMHHLSATFLCLHICLVLFLCLFRLFFFFLRTVAAVPPRLIQNGPTLKLKNPKMKSKVKRRPALAFAIFSQLRVLFCGAPCFWREQKKPKMGSNVKGSLQLALGTFPRFLRTGVARNYWPPAPHLKRKNRRAEIPPGVAQN